MNTRQQIVIHFLRAAATALLVSLMIANASRPAAAQPVQKDQSGKEDDYNQWKQALGLGRATDPATISVPPGFKVELLRSAGKDEGSWIALAFDPRGRAIISREEKGLLRVTLGKKEGKNPHPGPLPKGEGAGRPRPGPLPDGEGGRVEAINDSLLECRGLLWAYDSLYVNANNSKGLYRLRDTDGDDTFDDVRLLKATPGHVGHGRNDLALGPDGMIYSIHGDDVFLPEDFTFGQSPLRNYGDDRLLPCSWDSNLFNSYMKLPGGHVARTDKDGQKWEVVAGGLRNPYGLDFNRDGELFTYDADMEWDVGMPWYRPTRVLHLLSGGDFGWRRGTGAWRPWYPDSLPTSVDIGLGSPTAVKFGTHSSFPANFREALFILDWAYGRILAVHLATHGASYSGQAEPFVTGRPLNVTDIEFGPDGAMYFITGGRKTQSGLYRVSYVGPAVTAQADSNESRVAAKLATEARALRRKLEAFHGHSDPAAIDFAWPHLDSPDFAIRHAARVAIEQQPVASWQQRALRERRSMAATTALLALARVGTPDVRTPLVDRLTSLPWNELSAEQRIAVLRALSLGLARFGKSDEAAATRLATTLEMRYPDSVAEVNQQLCELLVFLESPHVVRKTLPLLVIAKTQEEKVHYLYTLRHVRGPWTMLERRQYFDALRQAQHFYGAQFLTKFVAWIKDDAVATLSDAEREQLAPLLAEEPPPVDDSAQLTQRPFVRQWQMDDLIGSVEAFDRGRDFEQGKAAFAAGLCLRCHRMGAAGSPIGPDLTQVSRRFGRRDVLLSILAPSQVIDEKYRSVSIVTHDGRVITGQLLGGDEQTVIVTINPLVADQITKIAKSDIESQTPTLVSPMPANLLNTLSKAEILDLLAYIEAGGEANHRVFQSTAANAK